MATSDDYLGLVTSEHRDRPLFAAVIKAITDGLAADVNLQLDMPSVHFDLDQAVGVQLDQIGLWVGIKRNVSVPISGVYFTWDGDATLGWGQGYWQGPLDPSTGVASLDDVTYRTVIRAKIAANQWDGTVETMYSFWEYVFGAGAILLLDNGDMSLSLVYDDSILNAVQKNLLLSGAFPLKPAGVRINYIAASATRPLFSWDLNLLKFQGWTGIAVWV
jgi:hypothetical protein